MPVQEVPGLGKMPLIPVVCRRRGVGRGICSLLPRAVSSSIQESQEPAEGANVAEMEGS